jgi:predicted DNA binding protein
LCIELDKRAIHPMHAFVCGHDAYGPTRLLQWNPHFGETNVSLFYIDGPREPFLSSMDDRADADIVESSAPLEDNGFYLFVREELDDESRQLIQAYTDEDVVICPPVVYDTDETMRISVVGTKHAIQGALDRTRDVGEISVTHIRSGAVGFGFGYDGFTDRQREVVASAVDVGYYEEPREATIEDVAAELGCAMSTAAEHLRKAERALVHDAINLR